MYLLDTNVVSELRKPSAAPSVLAWARAHKPSDLFLSVMTIFEIDLGIRRVERRDPLQGMRLRRWLTDGVLDQFRGRVLPIDADVALRAASLQVPDPQPDRDCVIAATALEAGMTIVTRNVKDFQPMSVSIVDPWEGVGR